MPETALNYEYSLQRALALSSTDKPRILDYGSGQGRLIALGLQRGADIYGTDVPGIETSDRVNLIEGGRIPFSDKSFDVVVSKQVFEHIPNPPPVLAEIHRVLKPGGVFLAFFPDASVWFEGHVGLYFIHWLLHPYLIACYNVGLGYFRDAKSASEWADWVVHLMQTEVFYHSSHDVEKWWVELSATNPNHLRMTRCYFALPQSIDCAYLRSWRAINGWRHLLASSAAFGRGWY